jgi:hypothetical protein
VASREDDSQRFLRAIGRDVDVDEDRLDYNPDTRALRMAGVGSRKKASDDRKTSELAVFVLRAARENPGCTGRALDGFIKAMEDAPAFRNGDTAKAARFAKAQSLLRLEQGPRSSWLHFAVDPTDCSPPLPTVPREHRTTAPTAPYRGAVVQGALGHATDPETGVAS